MLLNENAPFADAHIENLEAVEVLLKRQIAADYEDPNVTPPTREELVDAIMKLQSAQSGFQRYKVCFADEWAQKTRMRDRWIATRPKEIFKD